METASAPVIDLMDPTPAAARDAVHTNMTRPDTVRSDTVRPDPTVPSTLQIRAPQPAPPQRDTPPLDPTDIEHLVVAVSEAVTNVVSHGRPPVRFRLWTAPDRIVATVTDRGDGPADPFAGLLPVTDTCSAGWGLWPPTSSAATSPSTPPTTGSPSASSWGHPSPEGADMLPTLRDRPAAPRHEGLLAAGHRQAAMSTWARAALDRGEAAHPVRARRHGHHQPGRKRPDRPDPRGPAHHRAARRAAAAPFPTVTTGWASSSGPTR